MAEKAIFTTIAWHHNRSAYMLKTINHTRLRNTGIFSVPKNINIIHENQPVCG